MEIIVKRIAKKKTYTIGHLYLLKEDEVESRQSFSRHLKTSVNFAIPSLRRCWIRSIISVIRWSLPGAICWASR